MEEKLTVEIIFIVVPIMAVIIYIATIWKFSSPDCNTDIVGPNSSVARNLVYCANKCWSKHSFGKDVYDDDCYTVTVNATDGLTGPGLEKYFTDNPTGKAYFSSLSPNKNYTLRVRYNASGPEISFILQCNLVPEKFSRIIDCESKPLVTTVGFSMVVYGDATFYYTCCSVQSQPFITLMNNTANYLGGSKILIIWEYYINSAANDDPNNSTKTQLIDSLKGQGFSVDTLQHTSPLTYSQLSPYDQVWLIRPGICEDPNLKNYCNYQWQNSEFNVLKQFLSAGKKIFIITDYEGNVPQRVENNIVKLVNQNIEFIPSCFCGCNGNTVLSNKIYKSALTSNINNFPVSAATGLQMSCVA